MESQRFFFHSKNNRKSVRPVWRLRVNCRSSLFDSHLLVRSDTIGDTKRTSCCREVAMFFDVTVKTSMRCFFLPFGSMLKHGQHYVYCVRCQIDSLQETNDFWIFGRKLILEYFLVAVNNEINEILHHSLVTNHQKWVLEKNEFSLLMNSLFKCDNSDSRFQLNDSQ